MFLKLRFTGVPTKPTGWVITFTTCTVVKNLSITITTCLHNKINEMKKSFLNFDRWNSNFWPLKFENSNFWPFEFNIKRIGSTKPRVLFLSIYNGSQNSDMMSVSKSRVVRVKKYVRIYNKISCFFINLSKNDKFKSIFRKI